MKKAWVKRILIVLPIAALVAAIVVLPSTSLAATPNDTSILNGLLGDRAETVDIVLLLTILTILPSILLMVTCFTRIIIVLSFLRNAIGAQSTPPNQVLIGLALFLSFFVMAPVISDINEQAYKPYVDQQITMEEATTRALVPLKGFMLRQMKATDLDMFADMGGVTEGTAPEDLPMHIIIPSFITSEIKTAFTIGFFIYIPFIVIDLVVASTLMSMGMMMLPPVMISLPFKILMFVVVDGWTLTIRTLVSTFVGGG